MLKVSSFLLCLGLGSFGHGAFSPSNFLLKNTSSFDSRFKEENYKKQEKYIQEGMKNFESIIACYNCEISLNKQYYHHVAHFLKIPFEEKNYSLCEEESNFNQNLGTYFLASNNFTLFLDPCSIADFLQLSLGSFSWKAFYSKMSILGKKRYDSIKDFLSPEEKNTPSFQEFFHLMDHKEDNYYFRLESSLLLSPIIKLLKIFVEDGLCFVEKNGIFLPFHDVGNKAFTCGSALLFSKFLFPYLAEDEKTLLQRENIESFHGRGYFDYIEFMMDIYIKDFSFDNNLLSYEKKIKKFNTLCQSLKKELKEKAREVLQPWEWHILTSALSHQDFTYVFFLFSNILNNFIFFDCGDNSKVSFSHYTKDIEIFSFMSYIAFLKFYEIFLPFPTDFVHWDRKKSIDQSENIYHLFLLDYFYGHQDFFAPYNGFSKKTDFMGFSFRLNINRFTTKNIFGNKSILHKKYFPMYNFYILPSFYVKKEKILKIFELFSTVYKNHKIFRKNFQGKKSFTMISDFEKEKSYGDETVTFKNTREQKMAMYLFYLKKNEFLKNLKLFKKKNKEFLKESSAYNHYISCFLNDFYKKNFMYKEEIKFKNKSTEEEKYILNTLHALFHKKIKKKSGLCSVVLRKRVKQITKNSTTCDDDYGKYGLEDSLRFYFIKKFKKDFYCFLKPFLEPSPFSSMLDSAPFSFGANFSIKKLIQKRKNIFKKEINFFKDLIFFYEVIYSQKKTFLQSKEIYEEKTLNPMDSFITYFSKEKKSLLSFLFSFFSQQKDFTDFINNKITYNQLLLKHYKKILFYFDDYLLEQNGYHVIKNYSPARQQMKKNFTLYLLPLIKKLYSFLPPNKKEKNFYVYEKLIMN